MELKCNSRFVADGHERWLAAHEEKVRKRVRNDAVGKKEPVGFWGRIRIWFKTELSVLRGHEAGEKSSPEIPW
ncbi:MAG: hypothetical protein WCJ07_10705 [Verrucomicrobiota bacterium]